LFVNIVYQLTCTKVLKYLPHLSPHAWHFWRWTVESFTRSLDGCE